MCVCVGVSVCKNILFNNQLFIYLHTFDNKLKFIKQVGFLTNEGWPKSFTIYFFFVFIKEQIFIVSFT